MDLLRKLFGQSESDGPTAVNASEAKTRLDSADPPFLLDVREAHEYRAGHIAGAKLVPLGELNGRLDDLPRDREILVACRSGSRSGRATRMLRSAGYNAVNLSGGMIGWQFKGYPVAKGN